MLGYLAYYDYTWFDFKRSQLPQESVVIEQDRASNFFRPWSYAVPSVSSFAILDGKFKETRQDGQILIEYIRYEFINDYIERLESQPYVLNCTTGEQLAIMPSGSNTPSKVELIASDSLLFQQLCR